MSVIFRTLKKVKARPDDDSPEGGKLKTRREVYTFRTIVFSPVVLIGIALIAAMAYLGIMYAYQFYTPGIEEAGSPAAPPPPGTIPVEEAVSDAQGQSLPHWRRTLPGSEETVEAPSPEPAGGEPSPSYLPPLSEGAATPAADASGTPVPDETPEAKAESLSESVEVEESTDEEESQKTANKKTKRTYPPRQSADVSQLVADIQQAIQSGDDARAERLINRLAAVKGEGHPYVQKIRAFWDIHKGDYKSASGRLEKVLRKDQNDLEAGINMAIVEIKTDKMEAARARLIRLTELYPENSTAYELLQKLR